MKHTASLKSTSDECFIRSISLSVIIIGHSIILFGYGQDCRYSASLGESIPAERHAGDDEMDRNDEER